MSAKYLIRMDDVSPYMNMTNFFKFMKLFENYQIRPLLGIIPDNRDEKLINKNLPHPLFWELVHQYRIEEKVDISMHGVYHQYVNDKPGILGRTKSSEFANLCYDDQGKKIKEGIRLFEKHGLKNIDIFMPPSHSFDLNTLRVLAENNFKYITDGIAVFPYKMQDIIMLPQQMYIPRYFPLGYITICIHSDVEPDGYIKLLDNFIKNNRKNFISFLQYKAECNKHLDNKTSQIINKLFYTIYKGLIFIRKV